MFAYVSKGALSCFVDEEHLKSNDFKQFTM